jgi:hypothetical protein
LHNTHIPANKLKYKAAMGGEGLPLLPIQGISGKVGIYGKKGCIL